MGCSDSQAVQTGPKEQPKQPTVALSNSVVIEDNDHYFCGQLAKDQQLLMQVNLTSHSLKRMPVPQGLSVYNHSSMLRLTPKQYLLTGGIDFSLEKITKECYRFDSASGSATKLADMTQARYTHASILFKEQIYVVGGRFFGQDDVAMIRHCQKYEPVKNEWTVLPEMAIGRCTCMIMAWGNQIYVFGGYTGKFERDERVERLTIDETKWQTLDYSLNRGIESCFPVASGNNQVTIFGGNTNSGVTASVATIDFREQKILNHGQLKQPKMLHKGFAGSKEIFIMGGAESLDLQLYNNETNKSQVKDIQLKKQFSLESFEVMTQSQSSLIVSSGDQQVRKNKYSQGDEIILIFGTTEEPFILELNISVPYAQILGVPLDLKLKANSGGVLLQGLKFILFGGIEDDSLSQVCSSAYFYDHASGKVQKLASMNEARYSFAYAKLNNKIFVAGGGNSTQEGSLNILKTCQVYDIESNQWRQIASLPLPLMSPMCMIKYQQFYVFGGLTSTEERNDAIFKYNQKENIWVDIKRPMTFGIEAAGVIPSSPSETLVFGGRVYSGDNDTIWGVYFSEDEQAQFFLSFKGQMSEKKSSIKIIKPKSQDFYICLGGKKDLVSFYKCESLQLLELDGLRRLSQILSDKVQHLRNKDMKNYLIVSSNE